MNLLLAASGLIGAVNPREDVSLQRSNGYTVDTNSRQVPQYQMLTGPAEMQPASSDDLKHVDGLNMQGDFMVAYLYGSWAGVVREGERGGDLITRTDGSVWLVVKAVENWPDWSQVIVCRQRS